MDNNKLNDLPDNVWGNEYIFFLELDNNNISNISPSISSSKTLAELRMSNNTLYELPNELFRLNIMLLHADGNDIKKIPTAIGDATSLQYLKLQNNNNITNIPSEVGNLVKLVDFDIRHNAIEVLPNILDSLEALERIYLHNNPVCSNGWIESSASKKMQDLIKHNGAGCVPQCSIYCPNRYKQDGECDSECNSGACEYDGGDCK